MTGKHMRKVSRQDVEQKAINNVLASLRIEGLTPSTKVIAGLKACIEGKETTGHVLEAVIRRYVTIKHS